jgi:hypothetical protein
VTGDLDGERERDGEGDGDAHWTGDEIESLLIDSRRLRLRLLPMSIKRDRRRLRVDVGVTGNESQR